MGQFLDAVADPQLQVPAAGVRRGLAEHHPPLALQLGHRHGLQRDQVGQDVDPLRLARERGLFAADFLVFFLIRRLQLGFAPVSDDGVEGENVQRTVSVERRILVRFSWVGALDGAGEDGGQFRQPLIGGERLGRRREGDVVLHGERTS